MTPLPSPGQVLKVQLRWAVGTDANCMNVLHYRFSGTPPASNDCVAIGTHMASAFPATAPGIWPSSTILEEIRTTDLSSVTGQQGSWTGSKPGINTGTRQSAAACIVQSLIVNARYRGGHPRIYWPGSAADGLADQQHWTASAAAQWNTWLQAFLASIVGFSSGGCSVGNQCAVSYFQGHTWAQDQHSNWHKIPSRRATPSRPGRDLLVGPDEGGQSEASPRCCVGPSAW